MNYDFEKNPESRFDVKDYADNDSRFIRTVSLGQATFTENGEPGYFLIEGENLATVVFMQQQT